MFKIKVLLALHVLSCWVIVANAQSDSIFYHDMQMESQWGSSTVNDQFGCFIRVTPPVYPATLVGVRAYFRNAGPGSVVKWKAFIDPISSAMGGVVPLYTSSIGYTNPASGGTPNQDYPLYGDLTSANLIIYSGDVYIGAVQSSGFFGMGIDNLPNSSVAVDRQWQWMIAFGNNYWNTLASQASSGQFGLTAFFVPFATGVSDLESTDVSVFLDASMEQLIINIVDPLDNASLSVYDESGKLILSQNKLASQNTFDFSFAKSGVYTIVTTDSKRIYHRKIVKL